MNSFDPTSPEPVLQTRRVSSSAAAEPDDLTPLQAQRRRIFFRVLAVLSSLVIILCLTAFAGGRYWLRKAITDSLPQLDGSLPIAGLSAPVTVQRDTHGVPHLHAATLDDLVVAQGFVTAQDRLWQMDVLRRHAAGELAELLGPALLPHDRTQRTLQLRASADRAVAVLSPEQLHWLDLYARGVNASIAAQHDHLPVEFRILRYQPAPWTPRDSLLVALAMFQDLATSFPSKLNREALTARLPAPLIADLYPVGSWRDHPPAQPEIDLTTPQTDVPDIPLDETQTKLRTPTASPHDLLAAERSIAPLLACEGCRAGSNNWAVAGAHTASGKPLLSNDMHLAHNVPGTWYQADLHCPGPNGSDFHVAGVTLPGTPFVIVGHNDHIAWGFTNLGADVQDVYIEHLRGSGGSTEFQTPAGDWQPLLHQREVIHVRSDKDVVLDVPVTQHGGTPTPIISGLFPSEKRSLALRWTVYDPANITSPFLEVNSATDWPSFTAAFSNFGGPSQNAVYADDQGHIGYHAVGRIPLRGNIIHPSSISPVPVDISTIDYEWSSYIPFDQLPQAFDPPSGILATANARVTPDDYTFPITLDWAPPYRNERIWKVLSSREHLTPADMLTLQTDIYSDLDHVIAQRLAYAIDHSHGNAGTDKRLRQAADILRSWDGTVDANAAAPSIVAAARTAFWPLLLNPQLGPNPGDAAALYTWGSKSYAEEWLIMHTPARWLPSTYPTWDDLLADSVRKGLTDAHAPVDLSKWAYGAAHPIDIEHPLFSKSPLLQTLLGLATGTGIRPQSGDGSTIKQVGRTFGPSERFSADLADLDHSTLNLVLGESSNPLSPWFLDQWPAWYNGTTLPMPYTQPAVQQATTHTLTLTPN